jgi:hypothetical protein
MHITEVRDATLEDAKFIGANLRECDRREIDALTGVSPMSAVCDSYSATKTGRGFCRVGTVDDVPVVILGVTQASDDIGIPWMMATDGLYVPEAIRHMKHVGNEIVQEMQVRFKKLINVIDARNTVSITWLKSLGFVFVGKMEKFGFKQLPFWIFQKERGY